MALSNHDRVGRGFSALGAGLDTFLTRALGPELGEASWIDILEAVDHKNGKRVASYDRADPQAALRFLTEKATAKYRPGWYPLSGHLSRSQEAWPSELREVRNTWAHQVAKGFSDDDAYRALDTMERLLRACGQPLEADQVAAHRREIQRAAAAKSDRAASRAAGLADAAGDNLPAWREVLAPHDDVASGRFQAAEFAADLHTVASGRAASEYADPAAFFERTFLTEGLSDLLVRAADRLGGHAGVSPVINLQTTFGGGKTHSMLAVWHLASGHPVTEYPQEVQELLTDHDIPTGVQRVALVGNHLQAGAPNIMDDGTVCHTLWGVLAWRLGGPDGYAIVADADRTRTNPGDALRQLLVRYGPAVILIDEWVAYARELYGRDDLAGGTFDTQFTFAQTLTEAVKATPGVLLLISIPASAEMNNGEYATDDEEVGGLHGREALSRLQRVVGRVADQWRPADADEAFEIVRRRLFVRPDRAAHGTIAAVARAMVTYYRKHSAEFPTQAQDRDYEDKIRACYPIHPELFDRLYADWSTLPRFQRTRGVLRLMNTIIHTLWVSDTGAPLIMPGTVPLGDEHVVAELTQYLDDAWKAIITTDVDGPSAVPTTIDTNTPAYGRRHTARRLARTVFLGATPRLRSAQKGIDRSRVFLGTAVPGDIPGNFHAAIDAIADKATHFYSSGQSYWYDTQANTTRTAADYAEGLAPADVWAEITARLRRHQSPDPRGFHGVHIAPDTPGEVPDIDTVRLVIVPPAHTTTGKTPDTAAADYVRDVLHSKGAGARRYRNMLLFLAADTKRAAELDATIRRYLAWSHIVAHADTAFDLTANQKKQAAERAAQFDATATEQLWGTYIWLLWPEQPQPDKPFTLAAEKAEGPGTTLAERAADRARSTSQLSIDCAPSLVAMDLNTELAGVWRRDHEITVGALWSYYASYPYLRRLRDRTVLEHALVSHPDQLHDQFALAESKDGDHYLGLTLPDDAHRPAALADDALVVDIDTARRQRDADQSTGTPPGPGTTTTTGGGGGTTAPTPPGGGTPTPTPPGGGTPTPNPPVGTPPTPPAPAMTRYFGSFPVPENRPSGHIKDVLDEIVAQLRRTPDAEVAVSLEIQAQAPSGFDEAIVRTVKENGATLKLDPNDFDTD